MKISTATKQGSPRCKFPKVDKPIRHPRSTSHKATPRLALHSIRPDLFSSLCQHDNETLVHPSSSPVLYRSLPRSAPHGCRSASPARPLTPFPPPSPTRALTRSTHARRQSHTQSHGRTAQRGVSPTDVARPTVRLLARPPNRGGERRCARCHTRNLRARVHLLRPIRSHPVTENVDFPHRHQRSTPSFETAAKPRHPVLRR